MRHMKRVTVSLLGSLALAGMTMVVGCSDDDKNPTPGTGGKGGTGGNAGTGGSAGTGGTGTGGTPAAGGTGGSADAAAPDAGAPDGASAGALKAFTPPPANPGAKSVLFTASGEVLALGGYAFPPATMDDPAFVDGWEVKFSRLLVTVDKITLSENPDKVPTDQSMTGAVVAEVDGPWAIDLHKDDPAYITGKGGTDERAVPLVALTSQNKNANKPFDTAAGTRYGFGFDLVPATTDAMNVNLGPEALTDYAQMVTNKCAVLYVGTATWKGTTCTPATGFEKLPTTVNFNLCFKSPTTYTNCQNPDNDPAKPFDGEEHQRGISFKDNTYSIAQVTVHSDHPFWENTEHDSPAHFDQFAARAKPGAAGAPAAVTMDDLVGVDFQAYTDRDSAKLPWRSCLASYTPPAGTQVHFDPKSVPAGTAAGDPSKVLRDYADFATYNQSTQGHLNSDGLCYVKRNYPSPP
jgi:hypothetical protein